MDAARVDGRGARTAFSLERMDAWKRKPRSGKRPGSPAPAQAGREARPQKRDASGEKLEKLNPEKLKGTGVDMACPVRYFAKRGDERCRDRSEMTERAKFTMPCSDETAPGDGSSTDVDRLKCGYDRASNRTWRENAVSKTLSTPVYLDEFYTYDGLHRLKTSDRGALNGTKTGISGTPVREEDWTLDPLGNWSGYVQKTSGTTDLDQDRSVNKVNEITDISETTGTSWITPSYDKNGNMSVAPRPDDLANGYTCTYDAWNRMVKVEAGISTVAEYSYDGLHRRVTKTVGSTVRHSYFSAQWQVLEERLDTSTSADRQFVWGPLYVDHLILRTATPAFLPTARSTSGSTPCRTPTGMSPRSPVLGAALLNGTCMMPTARRLFSPAYSQVERRRTTTGSTYSPGGNTTWRPA